MKEESLHVVTGAFGFSGKYIAARLLSAGHQVRTLTNSRPGNDPHQGRVEVRPLDFGDYQALVNGLRGAKVFYNTYWVRFNYGEHFNYSQALANSRILFDAVREAGVQRIVHVSITNPSEDSPFEYFRDKAILEKLIKESGVSYAILRPAMLFGAEGILINNIAWMLRRFPFFGMFGDGRYRLQPIHVDDLARIAVEQGASRENRVINAIGPETYTFRELVELLGREIGRKRKIISVSLKTGLNIARKVGAMVDDILLTRDEIEGLMGEMLYVEDEPVGEILLSEWIRENRKTLGREYVSELARRRHRS
ncbi:MAG: NAD(P)H-binding protein [Syntrophotaleaceae bacterium]